MLKLFFKYNFFQLFLNFYKIKAIKNIKKNHMLRIGFYVIYDSTWGSRPLFEKLLKNSKFDVKVLVCPDISRGEINKIETMNKTYNTLCDLYGKDKVLRCETVDHQYIDYKDCFDLISVASPYDWMTYKYYSPIYLCKHKLVMFNDYGYQAGLKYDYELMKTPMYNMVWKLFLDNYKYLEIAKDNQYIHGKNCYVSGSCKMDKLSEYKRTSTRKTIMLSPHHTVDTKSDNLKLSNFIRLSDFFLELPKLYPQIDFIFRPHPLLITTLKKDSVWGCEKTESYLNELLGNSNVIYSTKGLYFDDFMNSDALIDDCGSFLAEYFYTNKPQCYIINSENIINEINSEFRDEFFKNVYLVSDEENIVNFINNVVLKENDYMKENRSYFSKEIVSINYPNVSCVIEQLLEKEFNL